MPAGKFLTGLDLGPIYLFLNGPEGTNYESVGWHPYRRSQAMGIPDVALPRLRFQWFCGLDLSANLPIMDRRFPYAWMDRKIEKGKTG